MTDDLAPQPADTSEALPADTGGPDRPLPNQTTDAPEVEAKPKPKSVSDSVAAALDKAEADEKADAEKAKAAEKPEAKAESEKPKSAEAQKPDTAAGQEGVEKAPSEGKQVNAPARLLPKAREVWANVPREVKSEFERFEREMEEERETHRASKQFHDELREYDTIAKGAKTSVKAALDRYVNFDKQLSQDFGKGMAAIAQDQRKSPNEAIASLLRAYNMTPAQFAQAVVKNPGAFQSPQMQPQQQMQQPRPDPLVQKAISEVQSLKAQLASQQVETAIIAPFAAANPRFQELQAPIVKLLDSGMVPTSLSPAERLEVAYDMAVRLNPSPSRPSTAFADPDEDANTAKAVAGKKSIGGSPGNGYTPASKSPQSKSIKDAVAAAMQQHGV